jgi:hypothetical protein
VKNLLFILLLVATFSWAKNEATADPKRNFVDYLQTTTKVRIRGDMMLKSDFAAGDATIRKDQKINFAFNIDEIQITSDEGIRFYFGPIPVNIDMIHYDNRTKKFTVQTEILGIGTRLGAITVEAKIKEAFGKKLEEASLKLRELLNVSSLTDSKKVLKGIIKIFTQDAGDGDNFPDVIGRMDLDVVPLKDEQVTIPGGVVEMKQGQDFSIGGDFHTRNNEFQISSMSMTSYYRLGFMREGKVKPEILLSYLGISESSGISANYENVYDNDLKTVVGTLELIAAAIEKRSPNVNFCEELEIVRDVIDKAFSMSITEFVDNYRGQLLAAGATEKLLKAIRDQAVAQYGEHHAIVVNGRRPSSTMNPRLSPYLLRPGACQ